MWCRTIGTIKFEVHKSSQQHPAWLECVKISLIVNRYFSCKRCTRKIFLWETSHRYVNLFDLLQVMWTSMTMMTMRMVIVLDQSMMTMMMSYDDGKKSGQTMVIMIMPILIMMMTMMMRTIDSMMMMMIFVKTNDGRNWPNYGDAIDDNESMSMMMMVVICW